MERWCQAHLTCVLPPHLPVLGSQLHLGTPRVPVLPGDGRGEYPRGPRIIPACAQQDTGPGLVPMEVTDFVATEGPRANPTPFPCGDADTRQPRKPGPEPAPMASTPFCMAAPILGVSSCVRNWGTQTTTVPQAGTRPSDPCSPSLPWDLGRDRVR